LIAGELEKALEMKRIGRSVICFETVDSTNDIAWDSVRQGNTDGLVVTAESQRAGRGRQGRIWADLSGEGLLFSVLLQGSDRNIKTDILTLASGVAVSEGIEDVTSISTELKWPNDVYIKGGKAAGILVEYRQSEAAAVIGVGINVNASPVNDDITSRVTCISEHVGYRIDRAKLLTAILQRIDRRVGGDCDIKELHDAWISRCGMINERVTVDCCGIRYTGRMADIDPMEGIDIIDDHGTRTLLPARWSTVIQDGEIS